MTAAFQLWAEGTGKLLMMVLTFLPSKSRVLTSASKGMLVIPSICNIKLSSWSVCKATGITALSSGPEDVHRETSRWDELSSDSSARAWKGSFLDHCAAAAHKAACSRHGWENTDVLSAGWLFSLWECLCLPAINGDSATYPSRVFELIHSIPPKRAQRV